MCASRRATAIRPGRARSISSPDAAAWFAACLRQGCAAGKGNATYFGTLSSAEAGGESPPDLEKLTTQSDEHVVMEQDMPRSDVLVIGAGPTGLVLALWLTKLGVKVRIIDKTAEPGTTSRALAVQARTLEFYHQVGIDDAVISGGVKVENLNLWVKGHRAARVPLRRTGDGLTPYAFALVFPQDAHERLLIQKLGE